MPRKKSTTRRSAKAKEPSAAKIGGGRFEPIREIRVRGAREHNLKGVDIDIPRDRLVVVTGLSGSGKSSLAFDTVFAEGQRKYMESLSAYARQFLDQIKKPDVESIEGLPPTIAIEQRSGGHNPRSTVATSTEIYDYLRLLYARCGQPTCWHPTKTRAGVVVERCGLPIAAAHPSQITDAILALPAGTKALVLAPIVRAKKGHHKEVVEDLVGAGFVRARVNGKVVDLRDLDMSGENPLELGRYQMHDIEAVVDRVVIKPEGRERLADSVETALKAGSGVIVFHHQTEGGEWADTVYSEHYACAVHPECALEELEPRLFSFNSPQGACPTCHGLGSIPEFDEELVFPDPDRELIRGAIAPWKRSTPGGIWWTRRLRRFLRNVDISPSKTLKELTAVERQMLVEGTTPAQAKRYGYRWDGVMNLLRDWFEKTESQSVKELLHRFMGENDCPDCHSDRLHDHSLAVFVDSKERLPDDVIEQRKRHGLTADPKQVNISDFTRLSVTDALRIINGLELSEARKQIAEPIRREVSSRLGFLASVGLDYLSLSRKTKTLSGGEAQRIRLATQVGSGLVGSCYVLDEPTIGLHARDNRRLIDTLRHLTDIGNTVLVVEHDEEMIRAADQVVDVGPGPGVHGGTIVAQGSIEQICKIPASMTGKYLSGARAIETPKKRRRVTTKRAVTVKGARANNLKAIDAVFPLSGIVCVTGVSGSGKSTLVNEILLKAARKQINGTRIKPGAHTRVNGLHQVDRIVEVDQSPIGRTPRSNPATYTKMFDPVRQLFAKTQKARVRGYSAGRFSFNVKGGRCEECQGQGMIRIAMHFLPDIFVTCEACEGHRYNKETLEVRWADKTIADVLEMTIEDACTFFEDHPKILRWANALRDVGLGYLELGQPSTTLSGGEAQRVKLSAELGKGELLSGHLAEGNTLYILDEPTTGLHFEDVRKLLDVLHRLADQGNTLVVIEHNLDVIQAADWVIDLGPEGGDGGGTIVAQGTPEQVARSGKGYTSAYLADRLGLPKKKAKRAPAKRRATAAS
ncbi:MAG: excinuclease ABC subunit UvrA [Planctomycetota bacterium]|nr:excinuclease ABC subunit UvrA [Planctomycetota bacterium]